jgi:PBSX family phage terminase large subunit
MIHSKHTLYKQQAEFVKSKARYTLYSGAIRGGKTLALIYRALVLAQPNTRGFLGAYSYPMISDIILPKLFDVLSVMPKHRWEWRKSESNLIIKFNKGDCIIMVRHFQDETKVQGRDLNWYCIDEGTVGLNEQTFEQLNGRLSEGKVQYGSIACNPAGISHFLYKYFFQCDDKHRDNRKIIKSMTTDNIYLPQEYLKDMDERPESWKRRFIEGQWGAMEGVCFDSFDPHVHIKDFTINESWDFFLSIDLGFTNPFCCLLIAIDKDANIYVCDEHYKAKMLIEHHSPIIKERFLDPYNIINIVVDPEDAEARASLKKKLNVRLKTAKKSVKAGIDQLNFLFAQRANGNPKILIHPRCTNTLREIESYEWEPETANKNAKESPKKVNDHAMDALRYFVYTIYVKRQVATAEIKFGKF